jgi:hypothetical protein
MNNNGPAVRARAAASNLIMNFDSMEAANLSTQCATRIQNEISFCSLISPAQPQAAVGNWPNYSLADFFHSDAAY